MLRQAAQPGGRGAGEIQPGDHVLYVDTEKIEWGPWIVVNVSRGSATVCVEGSIEHLVPVETLRRLGPRGFRN